MEAEYVRRRKQLSVTANTQLNRTQLGTTIDNTGATGTVTVQMPTDAVPGDTFRAIVSVAQTLAFKAGAAGVFTLAGVALTAGHGVSSATLGDVMDLECIGANAWRVHPGGLNHWADQA